MVLWLYGRGQVNSVGGGGGGGFGAAAVREGSKKERNGKEEEMNGLPDQDYAKEA